MANKKVYGLVCLGGGAHGAYQAGALKYIHEKFSHDHLSPFKVFAGASCGALNTTFFASQSHDALAKRLWLEELWLSFDVPAYRANRFKNILYALYHKWMKPRNSPVSMWSLMNPKPMTDIIRKGILREDLERALALGTTEGVAVAATELLSGRTCWFMEGQACRYWNYYHSTGMLDRIQHNHVAASCSVPVYLPPVKIQDRYYLDGSISLARPLIAAINMGATHILHIATDKPAPMTLPNYPADFKPRMSNVIGMLFDRLAQDAAQDEIALIDKINQIHQETSKKAWIPGFHRSLPFPEVGLPSVYAPKKVFALSPSKHVRESSG
ncbi:MAG: patatin-like phospholipase family protein, partial [Candidatus Omnitrophica bacterium]|nr:patatin-like phospholipase family protein [Candidatus Omnitrophota bacterium]